MVNRILFWAGFGLAARFWQLGIEMRPYFHRGSLWVYPVFGSVGAGFGYWMQGVEERQSAILSARKEQLLERRARRAQQEAEAQPSESA